MIVHLFSFVGLCLLCWLWVRWRNVKNYWAVRGVPFSPPHPIMGSLTFLQRENPGFFMKRIYQDIPSPYVGIWLAWRPALIINSPEIARRILVKDSNIFRNRFLSSGKTDHIGSQTIFLLKEPTWSKVRRQLTVIFTAAKLRAMQDLITRKTVDLVIRIENDMKQGCVKDLRLVLTDFTTDIFGEAAFGLVSEATRTGDGIIRKVTKELMAFNLHRGLSWSSIFFMPELVDYFGLSFFPRKTTKYLSNLINTIIKKRGGFQRKLKDPKDLLDALLKIHIEASEDDEVKNKDFILAQATIFLVGGFDTSGSAITWATLELAHHAGFQDKLYNELLEAKQNLNGKNFDPSTLASLPYLNAVIKESLRKFPPMGWLDRISEVDYVISEKLTIPAGTPVYINAMGMQWDPDYFPEPKKFDPDRFMPENENNIKPYTFLPFGDGPRNCIGQRFGYQTVRYALAAIFLHYRVVPLPTTPKADELRVEKKGMFFMPEQTVTLKFIKRHVV